MNSVNKKINHYCLAKVARGTYVGPSNCYRILKQDGAAVLNYEYELLYLTILLELSHDTVSLTHFFNCKCKIENNNIIVLVHTTNSSWYSLLNNNLQK